MKMFNARFQELSLSTDAFSRSHGYDKFVVALDPYTIQIRVTDPHIEECRSMALSEPTCVDI